MFIQVHLANAEASTRLPHQTCFGLFLFWVIGHWKQRSFSSKSAGSCIPVVWGVSGSPAESVTPIACDLGHSGFYSEGWLISPAFSGTAEHVAPPCAIPAVHRTLLRRREPSLRPDASTWGQRQRGGSCCIQGWWWLEFSTNCTVHLNVRDTIMWKNAF